MFKNIFRSLLLALPLIAGLSACDDKEEIIFDHELPQFELRSDAILLEVIMPQGTAADDRIYIAGPFNGGDEAAVGNPDWQLEKAQGNDIKWGIYLRPSTFVEGTSLADGFHFISAAEGEERSLRNEPVTHTDNPSVGTRTNITVDRWKSYFDKPLNPDEVVHDGYAVFVVDETGWDAIAMYAWGDAEAFGAWPGMAPTGTVDIDGVTFKYFDTGEANKGLNLNLIFNNNNGGTQLADYNCTLDKDIYLTLTADGVAEYDPSSSVKHDGFAVFVVNNTGWDDAALSLYQWGDVNDLNGAWPGAKATGTQTINGVKYLYFDMGEANAGLSQNLIFSNDGASQLGDFAFVIERDLYLELTNKAVEIDPETYTPGGDEPTPPEPTTTEYTVYLENLTGWSTLNVYAWGDMEVFGGWPGAKATGTKEIGGRTFLTYTANSADSNVNLIFNDGGSKQFDGPNVTISSDLYFSVKEGECTAINPADLAGNYRVYVEDKTGWDAISVYAWGDVEYFGGWPGKPADGTETVDGVVCKYWNISGTGETINLIFNNNGSGSQLGDFTIKIDKSYHLVATPDGVTAK